MKKLIFSGLILMFCLFITQGAMAGNTIPVGVATPMTGWAAGSGEDYFKGIKMAIDEINESGGLLNKQLEIIRFDSKDFAPEIVMQAADYLCAQKKVASVHAGWAGWGQDFRAYGKYDVPFFADDASQAAVDVFNEDPEKYYNCYQTAEVEKNQARSIFRVLKSLPYEYPNKKVVIITSDDSWGIQIGDTLSENFKNDGWKIAKRETVTYGTNEWGIILSQIRRIKPAIIHIEIPSGLENITFVQQFLRRPTDSIISLGWGLTPREVLDALGTEADGIVGEMPCGVPGPNSPNKKLQAWVDKFVSTHKHRIPVGTWGVYSAVKAWAHAVEQVGDAYNFKAVNAYIKENGYEGLQGLMKWDKENVLRAQPGAPIVHYQVQGGELHTIFSDPPLTPYSQTTFIKPRWIKN